MTAFPTQLWPPRGETSDAEPAVLNLAARVRNEARYHVPKTGEPPQAVVEVRSRGNVYLGPATG